MSGIAGSKNSNILRYLPFFPSRLVFAVCLSEESWLSFLGKTGTIATCMPRHSSIQVLEKKNSLQLQLEETLWPGAKSVTRKILGKSARETK